MSSTGDRDEITARILRAVRWPPAQPAFPVFLVGGPVGSGRTTLLRDLNRLTGKVHSAFVSSADPQVGSPTEIMSVLVWQLMKRQTGVGDLRFARFLLGRFAIAHLAGIDDRAQAGARMSVLLRELRRGRLPDNVTAFARRSIDLAVKAAAPAAPEGLGEQLLSLVHAGFGRLRLRAEPWWRTDGNSASACDALVGLSGEAHSKDPDERRGADVRLLKALLADLADDYRPLRRDVIRGGPRQAGVACVALIDDADRGGGAAFLEILVSARRAPGHVRDPLLVVASTGRPLLGATFRKTGQPPRSGWHLPIEPLRLNGLPFTRPHALPARVSAGHAGGFDLLDRDPGAVRRLLGAGQALRDELLDAIPADIREPLITCSAAHELTPTTEAAALGAGADRQPGPVIAAVLDSLWAVPDIAPVRLHPWLRTLLLLSLRHRPESHPDSWARVHQRLSGHFRLARDHDGVFYHHLALAGCEKRLGLPDHRHLLFVSRHLRRAAERRPDPAERQPGPAETARRWLDCLDAVCRAPNAVAADTAPAEKDVLDGFPEEPVTGDIARLVVGEWLRSDPLGGDPAWRLRYSGRRYGELAVALHASRPALADALYSRADELQKKADGLD